MIQGHLYRDGGPTDEPVDPALAGELVRGEDVFLWLDCRDPAEDELELLGEQFALHPLTLEDVRHRNQRSKIELFKDHAFVVLRPFTVLEDGEPPKVREGELHAFVGRRFMITLRYDDMCPMDEVVSRWERQPELLAEGGGFALYVLIDEVVDGYLTAVEHFEDLADDLEDEIFGDDETNKKKKKAGEEEARETLEIQERLFKLKRESVRLRRFAMPLRQGIDLIQEEPKLAIPSLAPYYRDVMDHVIRTGELVDNIRELLTSMLEVRVAQVANQLNEVMKKLTAWAGIILVPTLIAGVYGMNFAHMPELSWVVGYPMALGIMAAAAGALYLAFKRNGWI